MLRLALFSLVAVLLATSASADVLVYTWTGLVTGSGYYAEYVPPDTPAEMQLLFEMNTPNSCPPPYDERGGNYRGFWAMLTVRGWRYWVPVAFAEVHSWNGSCNGGLGPTVFRVFPGGGAFTEGQPIEPDAGPPIPWLFSRHGWDMLFPETPGPALPMEGGGGSRIYMPSVTGSPPRISTVSGEAAVTVWIWSPNSSDHLTW